MHTLIGSLGIRAGLLVISALIGIAFFAYGHGVYGYRLLEKYPPDWSSFGSIKAIGLLFATVLAYWALKPNRQNERAMNWQALPPGSLTIGVLIPLVSAFAVLFWPEQISGYVREQRLLSILTEVVFIAALFYIGIAALAAHRSDRSRFLGMRTYQGVTIMFGVVLLILMEEMSWGQHWLGFSTPDAFEGNLQNETNMHNFYTHRFEAAYYSTAVLAFVVLPFAWPNKVPNWLSGFSVIVPPRAFAIMALPLCGIFYETWNYVPYQLWFYFGLLIAAHCYLRETSAENRLLIAIMAATMVISQTVFLLFGHTMLDGHELTEIREFAIALAILAYGYVMAARFRKKPSPLKLD